MGEVILDHIKHYVDVGNAYLWTPILVPLLLATGVFFTILTFGVQFRYFGRSIKAMHGGRQAVEDTHGITPFQAFVTGLASRVGVGNIAGVAIAITSGGAGAVFWMWMTALVGMSSAFAESSLAQLFKIRDHDNQRFRGGPAYYIQLGLKQRWLGILFALALILSFGFVFNAVQANAIAGAVHKAWNWNAWYVGAGLVLLTLPIIFGGIRRIAQVAEGLVPIMAIIYLLVAIAIVIMNINQVPTVFGHIIADAFTWKAAGGGFLGAVFSKAMMLGIKRGLFSNEAGMGSAPNAAAAADVKHPVNQGFIQMLGVFVDTIVVCSCTAFIILLAGNHIDPSVDQGVNITQEALKYHVGNIGIHFLAVTLFLFAFSSIIGNYAYAESNVCFICPNPKVLFVFRILVLGMVMFGSVNSVPLVWDMADFSMAIMAIINLVAIILLFPYVRLVLKDYETQLKNGVKEPIFEASNYERLGKVLPKDVW